MKTTATAKEKYGFTDKETINCLVIIKNDIQNLEEVDKRLAKNFLGLINKIKSALSAILGIEDSIWIAVGKTSYTNEMSQMFDDLRYRQLGKYVLFKVISHILIECVTFKQDPSIALTKSKLAINLFEPLPDCQVGGEGEEARLRAEQIAAEEIKRIEDLLDIRNFES